jgi:hypothetical protein
MAQVCLERYQIASMAPIRLRGVAPTVDNNMDVFVQIDNAMQMAFLHIRAFLLKGDQAVEWRTTSKNLSYMVYDRWQDHLRHHLQEQGKPKWFPNFLWRKLVGRFVYDRVRRRGVDVLHSIEHPVTVIKLCPHADYSFTKSDKHVRFLVPSQLNDIVTK